MEDRSSSSGVGVMLSAVMPYLLNLCPWKEKGWTMTFGPILSQEMLMRQERKNSFLINKTG